MHCITLCKNCQSGKAIQKLISFYFLSKRFFVKNRRQFVCLLFAELELKLKEGTAKEKTVNLQMRIYE